MQPWQAGQLLASLQALHIRAATAVGLGSLQAVAQASLAAVGPRSLPLFSRGLATRARTRTRAAASASEKQRSFLQPPQQHQQQQREQQQQEAAAAVQVADHVVSAGAEGDVAYPEGRLVEAITRHWRALQACPSSASYTQRVSFDDFGARYIQQLEREEEARCRALQQLQRELEADVRSGQHYAKGGGVANRLVAAWLPLLTQAIEEEQQQVLALGGRTSSRRDRPHYGPYLLLLSAEDLAHITLQTVLSRVATALPEDDEADSTASPYSWGGFGSCGGTSIAALSAASAAAGDGGSAAGMVPAALLADSLGRAVNNRLKYLRFKHAQWQLAQRKAAAVRAIRAAQAAEPALGPATSSSLERYGKHNSAEAGVYEAGQARLAALQQLRGLGVLARRAAQSARADVRWDTEARIKVGAALLALLVENSHLPDGVVGRKAKAWRSGPGPAGVGDCGPPGFEYVYRRGGLKQQSFVRASAGLVKVLLADRSLAACLLTKVPPMLIPPLPWSSYSSGGYLTSKHWMMRTRYSNALQAELKKGMAGHSYDQVLDALNVLGNTPWRINHRVHAVLDSLWAKRSTAGGLPQQVPHKPPPAPGTGYRLVFEGAGLAARSGPWSKLERRRYVVACDDVRRLNRNAASLKADFLLKKQVADEFVSAPELYYPHTLDFRGRAYPLHPSLHHLGDDSCRGLLMFAEGVPLGKAGLDWLHVHLANVWGQGQDKLSFQGRREFTRSQQGNILAVAQNPLVNTWWQGAEKPWQTLAACFEIAAAMQHPEPAAYVSHLPVHMDGSCNGLQHYAALGRDAAGGKAVNLLPSDKPQDVYKGVAEIVARRTAAAAAAGDPEAARCVSLVDRKLVKQTVMTSVYGVTPIGARAQVEARLREKRADMKAKADLLQQQLAGSSGGGSSSGSGGGGGGSSSSSKPWRGPLLSFNSSQQYQPGRDEYAWMDDRDSVFRVSKLLADTTLDAIGEMFGSARAIMAWLAECARLVAGANAPVRWSSPLGLPITQPYHKLSLHNIATTTQHFSVVATDSSTAEGGGQWMKARQRSAFPPNFIHSIDSTHMMLTALACSERGIVFAGVHDSFWCHAGHVPTMNKLLRSRFVQLHTRQPDLLEDLLSQLQAQHPSLVFPPIPERGSLAVGEVQRSTYFFS